MENPDLSKGVPRTSQCMEGDGSWGGQDRDRCRRERKGMGRRKQGEESSLLSLLTRTLILLDQGSGLMNSFKFIKAPSPNTAALGIRAST